MDAIETFSVGDKTVNIYQDIDPLNPRVDFDHYGKMLCFHKRYNLGDEAKNLPKISTSDFENWEEMEEHLYKNEDAAVVLPLFLYDHGGITISTGRFSCQWDSDQVGFIYMTKQVALEAFQTKEGKPYKILCKALRDKVEACLKAEVEEYDQYLTGDVYGYDVLDSEGNIEDSCYGFYGIDSVTEEAKRVAA